ncbi:carcinoembryonic antigen-related cell adhesion molecule 21-like [Eptesicus fuscus]|uniref:carcinoembryonic antigen-related cell adhesion molecule 21-like n=1 Tax=Eptesicus fuscus TaxID=29078 RepID=UPI002403A6D5|nr:carcinoembryonic antigen-related cell adhesion molecule 21-like [Eptesicus fuscus]
MESLSAPIHRGPVTWHGLLLAVSLLNFWSPPSTAELAIVSTNAVQGSNAILRIRNKPPNAIGFTWYRWEAEHSNPNIATLTLQERRYKTEPAYSGRAKINVNGSLQLKNVTPRDTGIYTVKVHLPDSKQEIGFGRLDVYQPVRVPIILASNTTVMEHKDSVILACYTNAVSIQWFLNGMNLQLTERMKLSWENRILIIDPVRREDAGNYQCEASNPVSSAKSVPVELDIKL